MVRSAHALAGVAVLLFPSDWHQICLLLCRTEVVLHNVIRDEPARLVNPRVSLCRRLKPMKHAVVLVSVEVKGREKGEGRAV